MNSLINNLTGQRFERLIVVSLSNKRDKGRNAYWNCICDCGNTHIVAGRSLTRGKVRSCGCLHSEIISSLFHKGKGTSGFNKLFARYRISADARGIEFKLTKEELKDLVTGNCYYCNSSPKALVKARTKRSSFIYNGIDRIDNNGSYTKENCVSCCKTCNYSKRKMTQTEFYDWIKKVYTNIVAQSFEIPRELLE